MKAFVRLSAAGLAAVLVLTGCSGGNSSSSKVDGAPAKAPAQGRDGGKAKTPLPGASSRAVVYTATLRVENKDVTGAAGRAKQIASAAGGYVGSENAATTPGVPPSATITFKIPAARYQGVLDQLGSQLGRRVSLQQNADDATQEVADVDSRVKSAKATLASFRTLLSKAGTVGEVIRVEQEIADREADLESLQARQRSLAHQTAYATVNLQLTGVAPPPKEKDHRTGFTGGAVAGWHAFTAFLGGVALVIGWLLPFLGLAVLVGLPARYAWRRLRRA